MTIKLSSILVILALILAGCSSPAATQPAPPTLAPGTATQPTAMPTAMPTAAAPATSPTAAPTLAATAPAARAGGVQTYRILPEQSKVVYKVGEVFLDNNRFNLAIGTTQAVNGDIFLDFNAPEKSTVGPITVDISTFQSDSSRRDNAIRNRWLESARYPTATFTPKTVRGIPSEYQDGTALDLEIDGDLTVRDATQPVTFKVKATLMGEKLFGSATTEVLMSSFNFSPPDIAGMLKSEDKVLIEFEFLALPAA